MLWDAVLEANRLALLLCWSRTSLGKSEGWKAGRAISGHSQASSLEEQVALHCRHLSAGLLVLEDIGDVLYFCALGENFGSCH